MSQFSSDIKQIKHDVLELVAKYTYEGNFDQKKDDIPFEVIPTQTPRFRCCVYKEREIIRGRVKLANDNNGHGDEVPIVNVIQSACEGCPIGRFRVTENCQKCVAKKCVNACPFDAISIAGKGAYIDKDKCRECGRCASVCPYNAIADLIRPCRRSCPVGAITMDDNKLAYIDKDKCISCGACVNECPFGAIQDLSFMTEVIRNIKAGKNVYAMFAPAIEGQFGEKVAVGQIKTGLKMLGFKEAYEVGLGADAVAATEAKEIKERVENNEQMTTSCCPAFVNMIEKHFPKLVPNMSKTISPMVATARYIRNLDSSAVTVFIGPCIAKKEEGRRNKDIISYVITFEELYSMFSSQNINLEELEGEAQDSSLFGRNFALSGGVTQAALEYAKESNFDMDIACKRCNGAEECKKTLTLMNAGKLPESFVEGMACVEGCIAGPASILVAPKVKRARMILQKNASNITITENVEKSGIDKINMEK